MNLPNKLTILRILMTPVFLFLLLPGWYSQFLSMDKWGRYAAAVVFIIASVTDLLDGRIARKYNLVSEMGKFLDPIADKLLVNSALIALIKTDNLSVWIVFIILAREFIISAFRLVAANQGVVIAADNLGKIKTTIQIIGIVAILIYDFPVSLITDFPVGMTLMHISVIISIISAINYMVKNSKILKSSR
jgi:CDP-diacylglycerol--glycerol-3-phosphate 3-phosphatidyltransferase